MAKTVLLVKTQSGGTVKVLLDPELRVNRQVLKIAPGDQIEIESEQQELVKKLRSQRVANDLVIEVQDGTAHAELRFEDTSVRSKIQQNQLFIRGGDFYFVGISLQGA